MFLSDGFERGATAADSSGSKQSWLWEIRADRCSFFNAGVGKLHCSKLENVADWEVGGRNSDTMDWVGIADPQEGGAVCQPFLP